MFRVLIKFRVSVMPIFIYGTVKSMDSVLRQFKYVSIRNKLPRAE